MERRKSDKSVLINALSKIQSVLEKSPKVYDRKISKLIGDLISAGNQNDIESFAISDRLWVDVADEACEYSKPMRESFENEMARLGQYQIMIGRANIKTASVVERFLNLD